LNCAALLALLQVAREVSR